MKRTHDYCIFFDLGSDLDFSNIDSAFDTGERSERKIKESMAIVYSFTLEVIDTNIDSVFNTGERSEPEKFDYKKVKTTFGPPLLPIKLPHWTPPLTNLRGCPDHPLLPRLEREACAQFNRDKNMRRNAARDRVLLYHFNNSGVTKYHCRVCDRESSTQDGADAKRSQVSVLMSGHIPPMLCF